MRKSFSVPFLTILIGVFIISFLTACQNANNTQPSLVLEMPAELTLNEVLVLGDVAGDPSWAIEHFQPLADYLAENLVDFNIKQGKVIVTSDLETMMAKLKSGEVDLYFDSPYPALEVYEKIGAMPMARRWKSGVSEYYSVIVVHQDSDITNLSDLTGKIVAFDHPASTFGYLLPKAHLAIDGLKTTEVNNFESEVNPDEIGYIFAFGEETEAVWVLEGKVAAAAFSNGDFKDLNADHQAQLRIIANTPAVPRHVVLARPGLDEELSNQIFELLLGLHRSAEGRAILESFEGTTQFDALPSGPIGTMSELQELFASVRE
jgi:phosphonate transport system substrate-binding protein